MAVSAGSIYRAGWRTVRDIINDNVSTVSHVYAGFPDYSGTLTYPIIVMETAEPSQTSKGFGLTHRGITYNFAITCFAASNESLDQICDEVDYALTNNQATTISSGLHGLVLNATSTDHPIINGSKIHVKMFNASYLWHGDV